MGFDEAVADRLITVCGEAVSVLRAQRGSRASVSGEVSAEFRGPFAEAFARNNDAQSAARNGLISALEDVQDQVRFAKTQAEEARRELAWEQATARWHLSQGAPLGRGVTTVLALELWQWFSESGVPRPEVVLAPRPSEPHSWPAGGGSGTSAAVPDALEQTAAVLRRQAEESERVCQEVAQALGQFRRSCSWVTGDRDVFTPVAARFSADDREDAGYLVRIADAFRVAGQGTSPSGPVGLASSTLSAALEHESGIELLVFLSTAAPGRIRARAATQSWSQALEGMPPELIARWWAGLSGAGPDASAGLGPAEAFSAQQEVLLGAAPKAFGSLDGLPATTRVHANRLGAASDIEAAEQDLAEVRAQIASPRNPIYDFARVEFLEREIAYLEAVRSGDVQLYLYDRDESRIVEMIGTPGPDTQRAVTYVPGTFTSLKSFYDGGVQQISKYLVDEAPETVAFVYKDGIFPGEDTRTGALNFIRIYESNDPKRGSEAGEQLASFQRGMRTDPLLQDAEQDGLGHSAGYQILTNSEIHGAEYDDSISLSGSGMHAAWVADEETKYSNFVYDPDALLSGQETGLVWDGKVPSTHKDFTNHFYTRPEGEGDLIENHTLIATSDQENDKVLKDVKKVLEN